MTRRGIAMLITLAALVLTVAGAAAIARNATTMSLGRRVAIDQARADDLMLASDDAVLHWLEERADDVVLPSDAATPGVAIVSDRWELGENQYAIDIAAWDQCGMAPLASLSRGSPVRLGVDDHILRITDAVGASERTGLDVIAAMTDAPVFPRGEEVVVGAMIATHNPPWDSAGRSPQPPKINVNTAPIAILEAAMRTAGHADIDRILSERDAGRMAMIGRVSAGGSEQAGPIPVSVSDSWAVRVDVRVGLVQRSWWSIWVRQRGTWQLAQRMVIRS